MLTILLRFGEAGPHPIIAEAHKDLGADEGVRFWLVGEVEDHEEAGRVFASLWAEIRAGRITRRVQGER